MSGITYEPTREHWTPYQPWMRDVLADDARVSWGLDGHPEVRGTWSGAHAGLAAGVNPDQFNFRIHPDDCPERPAEDDPDEALAKVVWDAFWIGTDIDAKWELNDERPDWLRVARAARKHIAREQEDALVDSSQQVRAEKAEAERDEAQKEAKFAWTEVARARAERNEALVDRDRSANYAAEWKARHEALRADVERVRRNRTTLTGVLMCIADVLDRDDERAAKGEKR